MEPTAQQVLDRMRENAQEELALLEASRDRLDERIKSIAYFLTELNERMKPKDEIPD